MSMPDFFADILSRLLDTQNPGKTVAMGQGLNFPKHDLYASGADIPVLVKKVVFAADEPDGYIRHVPLARWKKVPALIMPRGVGYRYYCAFNECKAFSYSSVEIYLPDELWCSSFHYGLWAYMNSSFVWLYREITGRKNLGGGMLKAEATDLKKLPLGFEFDFAQDVYEVYGSIRAREPLPIWEELDTEEHLAIDDMIGQKLGFGDQLGAIRAELREQVAFRRDRSRT